MPSFVCSTMIQTLCDDNAGCAVFTMTCSYSLGSRGSTGGVVTMAHNWPTTKSHTSGTPSCCPGRPESESTPKLVAPVSPVGHVLIPSVFGQETETSQVAYDTAFVDKVS